MMTTNPVLRRELVASLRTYKSFILQFLFVGSLAALVLFGWEDHAEGFKHSEQKRLAETLFRLFAYGSLVMIAVLAPAFSAGSLTLEKERRTLDLLLTTPLPPRAIVSGKLLASLAYLVLLIISTLPVLSVCFLLPGLDPSSVPALYLILTTVALTFGMIGLTASALLDRTQASLAVTYLVVLPLALILLLVAYRAGDAFFTLGSAAALIVIAGVFNLVLYAIVIKRMRKPFDPTPKSIYDEDITKQAGLVLMGKEFPDKLLVPGRTDELMPDGANPIKEKELRCEIFGSGTLFVRLLIQIATLLSIPFIIFLYSGSDEWIFVSYLIVFAMLIGPAFACGAISKEKEQRTLDLLCTTLIRPHELLFGKLYTALRFSLVLVGLLSVSLLFAAGFSSKFGPFRVELLGYAWVVLLTLVFSVIVAMFFSMVLDTTLASMIATYTTILLLFLAPLAVEQVFFQLTDVTAEQFVWYTFPSPLRAATSINQWGGDDGQRVASAINQPIWIAFSLFYVALSALLLLVLQRGLRRLLRTA